MNTYTMVGQELVPTDLTCTDILYNIIRKNFKKNIYTCIMYVKVGDTL